MKFSCGLLLFVCLTGVGLAQNDGRATEHVFPQFADGRFSDGSFYRSALHVTNPSATATGTCTMLLRGMTTTVQDRDNNPLPFGVLTGTISPNFWDILRTPGTAPFQSGYASVSCTLPVNAVVIYGFYSADGTKLSEAAVFSSPPGTTLQLIADQRENGRLGVAISNDSDIAAIATLAAGSSAGTVLGTAELSIPPRSNYVKFLDEAIPGLPPNYIGQVLLNSATPLQMIGLRFTGLAFTTIPASVR